MLSKSEKGAASQLNPLTSLKWNLNKFGWFIKSAVQQPLYYHDQPQAIPIRIDELPRYEVKFAGKQIPFRCSPSN